ncbi:MAG: tetratricopeptide repeat protein, partial [Gemmatimonadota bacterium]
MLLTFVAVAVLVATPAFAQRSTPPGSPASRDQAATQGDDQHRPGDVLARADSAYAAGDRTLARALYAQALARDSALSRAAFRLAQLETSPERALALYRHYETLEPRDAWGFMAEGDLLGRMERYGAAQAAYTRAASVAPDERDVVIGRARLHLRAGRPDIAATELARWTERHAEDGEAWDLLGSAHLRSGRPRAAVRAFSRAGAANGTPGAAEREAMARALAAPAVEPIVGYQRDSDGNRTSRMGGVADAMVADGVRLGAGVERVTIGDDLVASNGVALHGRLSARPAPGVRLDLQGGAVRLSSPLAVGAEWTTPQGDARVRLRAPRGGPALELRAQRLALGTAPVLVANRVTRSEVRATAEVPLTWVRLRGSARAGRVDAQGEAANTRLGAEGALVLPLGDQVQLYGQYRW